MPIEIASRARTFPIASAVGEPAARRAPRPHSRPPQPASRLRVVNPEAYLSFPVEGLAYGDPRLLEWLATHSDPQLWHLLACEMLCETTEQLDILLWIVQQPECDKATAAAALVATEVDRYIYSPADAFRSPWSAWYQRLASEICHRVDTGFYTESNIADPSLTIGRSIQQALVDIEAGCALAANEGRELGLPRPDTLLTWQYPDASFVRRYDIDQDAIIRLDVYDESVRKWFSDRWP